MVGEALKRFQVHGIEKQLWNSMELTGEELRRLGKLNSGEKQFETPSALYKETTLEPDGINWWRAKVTGRTEWWRETVRNIQVCGIEKQFWNLKQLTGG